MDLVFTGIVVAGIAWSRGGRAGRARVAMASLAVYVGIAALLHERAVDLVRDAAVGRGSASSRCRRSRSFPSSRFPRSNGSGSRPRPRRPRGSSPSGSGPPAEEKDHPVPGRAALLERVRGRRADVPAGRDRPAGGALVWRQREVRGPDVPAVRAVRGLADVETYLWFARFPAASVASDHGRIVVTFYDMRFSGMPGRRPFLLRVIEAPGAPPLTRWGSCAAFHQHGCIESRCGRPGFLALPHRTGPVRLAPTPCRIRRTGPRLGGQIRICETQTLRRLARSPLPPAHPLRDGAAVRPLRLDEEDGIIHRKEPRAR